jgi:tRNA nucleotidyltransferase (CCA-adding enzyme)
LPEIPTAGSPSVPDPAARPVLVRDAMTRSVLCVSEDMDIEEVAHMMINKNVEQFPVVNEAVLTGMLFRSDIIRKLFGR